jgi:hypothetical protein
MAEGHREAAPRVLDGREHEGTLPAEGRRLTARHIASYPRILTAANNRSCRRPCPLIQTAKLNGVDPMAWLTDVLERRSASSRGEQRPISCTPCCRGIGPQRENRHPYPSLHKDQTKSRDR